MPKRTKKLTFLFLILLNNKKDNLKFKMKCLFYFRFCNQKSLIIRKVKLDKLLINFSIFNHIHSGCSRKFTHLNFESKLLLL